MYLKTFFSICCTLAVWGLLMLDSDVSPAYGKATGHEVSVRFTDGNRPIVVTAPGVEALRASFSATLEIGGARKVLSSADGNSPKALRYETEKTPYGTARIQIATVEFPEVHITLDLRVGQVPGVPGVLLQPVLHNNSTQPVNLISLAAVDMPSTSDSFRLSGEASQWIVTALDRSYWFGPPLASLANLRDGKDIHDYGGIYREDGTGMLFAPVGQPIAYLESRVALRADGQVTLLISSDMSRVRVDPVESRAGQQAVLLMEPPRQALPRWTE